MKKLLVAVLAISSLSAFADHHQMVRLDGCGDGTCDTLDFDSTTDKAGAAGSKESKTQDIALNYAMLFGGNFGAGLAYESRSATSGGDVVSGLGASNTTKTTVSLYYNFKAQWHNTSYVALHLASTSQEDEKGTKNGMTGSETTLEYGHRHPLGSLAGVKWMWVPSVAYAMGSETGNASGSKEDKTTSLSLNAFNFAVAF